MAIITSKYWFVLGAIAVSCSLIAAQSIPPTWRKPAITIPRSESIQRSAAAIDVYRATIPAPGESESNTLHSIAQMCIEMADFDLLTNQEKYKQVLKSYIPATERTRPGFAFKIVRGGINFGNAAARAYEAYKDEDFLDYAVKAWNSGRNYTLSEEDIDAGIIPVKNFTLQRTCGTTSMAGGTFELNGPNDAWLDSWATGTFLVLSASLYKITSNETYLSTANSAARFLLNHMYTDQGRVISALSGKQEDQCRSQEGTPSHNTGMLMQGISLLNSITPSVEDDALINDMVVNDQWQNSAGILTDVKSSGPYVPRGLLQTYNASSNTTLRNYISAYLSTQYNAVIDYASGPGDIYAPSWTPDAAARSFDGDGQLSAISVLLAGIALANETVTSTASFPTSTTSQNSDSVSKTPAGPIVGGVIGGLAFLTIIVFLYVFYDRRRRLRAQKEVHITPPVTGNGHSGNYKLPSTRLDSGVRPVLSDTTTSEPAENEFMARQMIYRREPKGAWGAPPDYESQWES